MSHLTVVPTPAATSATALDYSPIVINEQQITAFNFFQEGKIVAGMRFQNELYSLAYEVSATKQLEAYNLACAIMVQGGAAVVSVSKQRYQVWVSLRSPEYAAVATAA